MVGLTSLSFRSIIDNIFNCISIKTYYLNYYKRNCETYLYPKTNYFSKLV